VRSSQTGQALRISGNMAGEPAEAQFDLVLSDVPASGPIVWHVSAECSAETVDPYDSLRALRAAVFAVLPDVPLRNVTTMEEMFSRRMAQRRLNMLLLGLFGLLGLTIAGVGVYGLMAFIAAQKTREIGVRMALGASRTRVVGMVVAHAFAP
jgi:FtsX-like permease family